MFRFSFALPPPHFVFSRYSPYREGKHWWPLMEMLRILLLTSMIGWLTKACALRVMSALLISVAFLLLFTIAQPYRKATHFAMEACSISIIVVSMTWASAGLAGQGQGEARRTSAERAEDDSTGVVVLHATLLALPALYALFTVGSTVAVWFATKEELFFEAESFRTTADGGVKASASYFDMLRASSAVAPDQQPGDHDDEAAGQAAAAGDASPGGGAAATPPQPGGGKKRKGKKRRRRKKAGAKRRRRKRKKARKRKSATSWSSWSSASPLPSLQSSSSSSSSDSEDGGNAEAPSGGAPAAPPARRAGLTGYVATTHMKTGEEEDVEDELRQAEAFVTLGFRKGLTDGNRFQRAAAAAAADRDRDTPSPTHPSQSTLATGGPGAGGSRRKDTAVRPGELPHTRSFRATGGGHASSRRRPSAALAAAARERSRHKLQLQSLRSGSRRSSNRGSTRSSNRGSSRRGAAGRRAPTLGRRDKVGEEDEHEDDVLRPDEALPPPPLRGSVRSSSRGSRASRAPRIEGAPPEPRATNESPINELESANAAAGATAAERPSGRQLRRASVASTRSAGRVAYQARHGRRTASSERTLASAAHLAATTFVSSAGAGGGGGRRRRKGHGQGHHHSRAHRSRHPHQHRHHGHHRHKPPNI